MSPRARLALLVATLAALWALFTFTGLVDQDALRARIDAFGALAPLAYVPVSVVLGLLFGPVLGGVVSLTAATINAVLALLIARRGGQAGVEELSGPRASAATAAVRRHGMGAVIAQRLAPGVPDGPLSYAFGALGLTAAQIALGTLIGAAPRAFAYASLGSALDDPTSTEGLVGLALLTITAIVGLLVARRVLTGARRGEG